MSRKSLDQQHPQKRHSQSQSQSQSRPPPQRHRLPNISKNRDGLGAYLEHPESFPASTVIYHSPDFVAIHDAYPKASVHLLLLPRDPARFFQHPFDALEEDPAFLAQVRAEADNLRHLVGSELRRKFGRFSRSERERQDAMESDPPPDSAPDELPPGRNWAADDVLVGIHAHPSMNHLHIHILSVDRHGARLRHRKHYNSFSTPFFVPLADFPLDPDDPRRHPGREGYLQRDLVCWRCGENFGNKFARLKEHLEEEFEEWKTL